MSIKLGIIGFGYMGHWHLANAPKAAGVEVVSVYDVDSARVEEARSNGLLGFDTLEAFLQHEAINTVLIATPNDAHCDLACKALAAKKHVICEKPAAMSVAELDLMIRAANENGRIFTAHQNRRWDKDYQIIKKMYDDKMLGDVYSIQSRLHGSRGAMFGWRAQPEHGGGMLYDWGVHFVDQILNMTGFDSVKSVFCKTAQVKTMQVEDHFCLLLNLKNNVNVQIEIGTWVLKSLPRWMLLGTAGSAFIDDFSCQGKVLMVDPEAKPAEISMMTSSGPTRTFAPRGSDEIVARALPVATAELVEYYQNLRDAMEGKCQPFVLPSQIRAVMTILEAAFVSAKTGNSVEIQ